VQKCLYFTLQALISVQYIAVLKEKTSSFGGTVSGNSASPSAQNSMDTHNGIHVVKYSWFSCKPQLRIRSVAVFFHSSTYLYFDYSTLKLLNVYGYIHCPKNNSDNISVHSSYA
jgi:hypothetical protein